MLHKLQLILISFLFFNCLSTGQNIDIKVLREINLNRNTYLDGTYKTITNSAATISAGLPVGMLGIGLIKRDSVLIRNAVVIGASVVSSAIVCKVIKNKVQRPRPYTTYPDIEKMTSGGGYSFPSGHTSGAFSLATSLSLEYPKWYIIVPSYAWASTVAYSRMDLGVHYPSDVLMGAVLGVGSAYLCHYLNKKFFKVLPYYGCHRLK